MKAQALYAYSFGPCFVNRRVAAIEISQELCHRQQPFSLLVLPSHSWIRIGDRTTVKDSLQLGSAFDSQGEACPALILGNTMVSSLNVPSCGFEKSLATQKDDLIICELRRDNLPLVV